MSKLTLNSNTGWKKWELDFLFSQYDQCFFDLRVVNHFWDRSVPLNQAELVKDSEFYLHTFPIDRSELEQFIHSIQFLTIPASFILNSEACPQIKFYFGPLDNHILEPEKIGVKLTIESYQSFETAMTTDETSLQMFTSQLQRFRDAQLN